MLSVAEAAAAPPLVDRDAIAQVSRADDAAFRQLAPLLAGAERAASYVAPDRSATDTDAVLSSAGFSADEIARLRADGVIG